MGIVPEESQNILRWAATASLATFPWYTRADNVTWSHLAFPAKDETQKAIAKSKTRIFR